MTTEGLLEALRHPLSQHIDLQVSAAQGQGWEHDRLSGEAQIRFMQIFDEAKARSEALVLAACIPEASSVIDEAWKACEEVARAAFPPNGDCLETDGGRHWFVVAQGSFRQYSRDHYGDTNFGRPK